MSALRQGISGNPGGLAVDGDAGVWLALTEGWSVMRLAPDGSVDRVIGLPVPSPTDLALASAPLSGRLLQRRV
ncbi:MAG: SMP-30/gluconolactonase/LRE family protein [Rhodoferax sp.]|nr:SMP-30/gluconolactonase/LRE family protein [Rhodoferax sp.]